MNYIQYLIENLEYHTILKYRKKYKQKKCFQKHKNNY